MGNLDRAILLKQIDRLYRDGSFTAQSDGQLLDRYLGSRDEAAFEAIVNLHGPMVLSLCRRFLRDPRDIEDAFQATFLVLARKAGSIRNREVLSSWLYGVAYRIAVRSRADVLRRRSVEMGVTLLDDHADVAARDVDEIGPVLDQELSRLPEKYRAPLVLCYLKEQTHDQAAAELRWPVGTVRSRLARGRELLKQRLTRRGCSPATAMLIAGPAGSFRSFTAAVPQSLVHATVAAAGRYLWGTGAGLIPGALAVSSTSTPSLSGSATTLAQGVLMTMSLSQIKLVAAGVTTIGLLAGGMGAGAWALGSPGPGQQSGQVAPVQGPLPKPAAKTGNLDYSKASVKDIAAANSAPGVEARLADLERKLDLLLERLNPPAVGNNAGSPPLHRGDIPRAVEGNVPPPGRSPFEEDRPPTIPPPPRSNVPIPSAGSPLDAPTVDQPRQAEPMLDDNTPPLSKPSQPTPPPTSVLPSPIRELPPLPAARLPEQSGAQPQSPAPLEPSVEVASLPQMTRARRDPFESSVPQRSSLKEIEAQIQIARQHFERNKALYAAAAIGKQAYDEPLDQIRVLIARLEGMGEDYADEIERLKVEIVKKQAEFKLAEAEHAAAAANVSIHTRLNQRKPGMIAQEDLIKGESESASTAARVQVRRAELQDTEIRMNQINRRIETIKRDVAGVLKAMPEVSQGFRLTPDAVDPEAPRG